MGIFLDDENIIQENAQYHVLPKFKMLADRYPELGRYQRQLGKAETELNKIGKDSPISNINKVYGLLLGFFSDISEWASVPFVIVPIVGWITLPLNKLSQMLIDQGAFELAKSNTRKMIAELGKVKAKSKDKSVKKACDNRIDKLQTTLEELGNKKKAGVIMKKESTNYFAMMEADDQDTNDEINKVTDNESNEEDTDDGVEATKEFFDMLNSIQEGDGCGECPDDDTDDITDDDEVSVDVEVDEFYVEESCKSSKKKSKKKAVKEDDAEEDEDSDDDQDDDGAEDSVEEGTFRDDFYDSDAEAAAAIHNNVTDEFFATLAAIKEEQ